MHCRRLHPAAANQRVERPGESRDYSGDDLAALSQGDLLAPLDAGQDLGRLLVEYSYGYFTHTGNVLHIRSTCYATARGASALRCWQPASRTIAGNMIMDSATGIATKSSAARLK